MEFPLLPLENQVGGHASFLRLTKEAVCKPLSITERDFYAHLPFDLQPFTASYLGLVQVNVKDQKLLLNQIQLERVEKKSQLLGSSYQASLTSLLQLKASIEHSLEDVTEKEQEHTVEEETIFQMDEDKRFSHQKEKSDPKVYLKPSPEEEDDQHTPYINPWSLYLYSKTNQKSNLSDKEFLLLQDLTSSFRYPCILDLKMGTRQHGWHVPSAKKKSHQLKVMESTSFEFGIRLCGMQVYRCHLGNYFIQDKYDGRKMKTRKELKKALVQFLYDGKVVERGWLPDLLQKLKQLKKVIFRLERYRFFSSSLLLIYDGHQPGKFLLKMVDFAHCVTKKKSLIEFEKQLHQSPHYSKNSNIKALDLVKPLTKSQLYQTVREALFKQEKDDLEGPDLGYIKGLETLISLVEELLKDSVEEVIQIVSEGNLSAANPVAVVDLEQSRFVKAREQFEGKK